MAKGLEKRPPERQLRRAQTNIYTAIIAGKEGKVNKGRAQLKCCGEMAEIAADIMMIVTGIYSQIEGGEEKEAFKFGMQMLMMNSKSWADTMEGPGVCIVIPHRREERND